MILDWLRARALVSAEARRESRMLIARIVQMPLRLATTRTARVAAAEP